MKILIITVVFLGLITVGYTQVITIKNRKTELSLEAAAILGKVPHVFITTLKHT